jgi:hypothetical protein
MSFFSQFSSGIARLLVGRLLEKHSLLEQDIEQSYLTFEMSENDMMSDLVGSSITYRVAVGKNNGYGVRFHFP